MNTSTQKNNPNPNPNLSNKIRRNNIIAGTHKNKNNLSLKSKINQYLSPLNKFPLLRDILHSEIDKLTSNALKNRFISDYRYVIEDPFYTINDSDIPRSENENPLNEKPLNDNSPNIVRVEEWYNSVNPEYKNTHEFKEDNFPIYKSLLLNMLRTVCILMNIHKMPALKNNNKNTSNKNLIKYNSNIDFRTDKINRLLVILISAFNGEFKLKYVYKCIAIYIAIFSLKDDIYYNLLVDILNLFYKTPYFIYPSFTFINYSKVVLMSKAPVINMYIYPYRAIQHGYYFNCDLNIYHDLLYHGIVHHKPLYYWLFMNKDDHILYKIIDKNLSIMKEDTKKKNNIYYIEILQSVYNVIQHIDTIIDNKRHWNSFAWPDAKTFITTYYKFMQKFINKSLPMFLNKINIQSKDLKLNEQDAKKIINSILLFIIFHELETLPDLDNKCVLQLSVSCILESLTSFGAYALHNLVQSLCAFALKVLNIEDYSDFYKYTEKFKSELLQLTGDTISID